MNRSTPALSNLASRPITERCAAAFERLDNILAAKALPQGDVPLDAVATAQYLSLPIIAYSELGLGGKVMGRQQFLQTVCVFCISAILAAGANSEDAMSRCRVIPLLDHEAASQNLRGPEVEGDPCWRDTVRHSEKGTPIDSLSQYLHGVPQLQSEFHVRGEDIKVGVWDEGWVLASHVEFGGRVAVGDLTEPGLAISRHATHVAGIIAASGRKGSAQGIAPLALIESHSWSSDTDELLAATNNGLSISNHSYGVPGGWRYVRKMHPSCASHWIWNGRSADREDVSFGLYNEEASQFDDVAFRAPHLSIFVAAGNERGWAVAGYGLPSVLRLRCGSPNARIAPETCCGNSTTAG